MAYRKANILYSIFFLMPILIFGLQGPLLKYKLKTINSASVKASLISKHCTKQNCQGVFELKVNRDFLVIGHILRNFKLYNQSGSELMSIARSGGLEKESWVDLQIYKVKNESKVTLVASWPKSARLNGFVGIYPRQTNSREVLNIPQITPKISFAAQVFSIFLLVFMLLGAKYNQQRNPRILGENFHFLAIGAVLCALNLIFSGHFFDNLFPNPIILNHLVRTVGIACFYFPLFCFFKNKKNLFLPTIALISLGLTASVFGRTELLEAPLYAYFVTFAPIATMGYELSRSRRMVPLLASTVCLLDGLRVFGVLIPDFPPVYWNLLGVSLFISDRLWITSSKEVMPQAMRALKTIKQNIYLEKLIKNLNHESKKHDNIKEKILHILPLIPEALNCKIVSILVNIPGTDPITFTYNAESEQFNTYDDGKIQGGIFLRVGLYGQEFWFETYESLKKGFFSTDKNFIPKTYNKNYKRFCALPIKHGAQAVGAISFTGFNDDLFRGKNVEMNISEVRQRINFIGHEIHRIFLESIFTDDQLLKERKNDLRDVINEARQWARTMDDFKNRLCESIGNLTERKVLLFKRMGDEGVIQAQYGLDETIHLWNERNLNLKNQNVRGPAVVAFNEKKSSRIKDLRELEGIHERTIMLLDRTNVDEIICIPIDHGKNEYVLMLLRERSTSSPDPIWQLALDSIADFISSTISLVSIKVSMLSFVPQRVMEKMLEGEDNLMEQDHGLILMLDLRNSTKISNIVSGATWMDMIQKHTQALSEIGKKYGFILQTVKWDEFCFTQSSGIFDDSLLLKCETFSREVLIKVNEFMSLELGHIREVNLEKFSNGRICISFGDISRDVTMGTNKYWTIIGNAMAKVSKLENTAKGLTGNVFIDEETLSKVRSRGNLINTGEKRQGSNVCVYTLNSCLNENLLKEEDEAA